MMARAGKTPNTIFATVDAARAMPVNPSAAAIGEMIRAPKARVSTQSPEGCPLSDHPRILPCAVARQLGQVKLGQVIRYGKCIQITPQKLPVAFGFGIEAAV